MNDRLRATIPLLALMCLLPGCGSSTPDTPTKPVTASDAGPNRRLQFKDEYKQMLGNDGQYHLKPGMKPPPGVTKK